MNGGFHLTVVDAVTSTNDYLKERWRSLPHGEAVFAHRQTAGKGRRGHTWAEVRPGDSMAFSVLLKETSPGALRARAGLLPLLCGMAVRRALCRAGADAAIKWPNDLVLHGRKVCGILCESGFAGDSFYAVCGMGVNLRQTRTYFDSVELPHATSVELETGLQLTGEELAHAVLVELSPLCDTLLTKGFSALREEYEAHCATLGREVLVTISGEQLQAFAKGVGEDGALLCEKDGRRFPVYAGEASVRGLYGYV